jgi:microcystin-dependent protein
MSADFSFLTLRNLIAYQPNGARVPQNYILTVSTNGAGVFSNVINLSSINTSSINTSTLNANIANINILSTTVHIGNNIIASTLVLDRYAVIPNIYTSSIIASSVTSAYYPFINTSTITVSSINNTFGITTSSLNVNHISSGSITVDNISTFDSLVFLDNSNNTIRVIGENNDLYVNGFPVLTEGNLSSVSSLYWEDDVGQYTLSGGIFNKNLGQGFERYMVGVGTNSSLNGTLSVKYNGLVTGNAFHISSYNNVFAIKNKYEPPYNFMSGQFINNQDDTYGCSLEFIKTQNFNSTVSTCELGYIDFYGLNDNLSTARGAYILARQTGPVSTFTTTDLQFVTCTSSTETINMVINSIGNVGIGTTTPTSLLQVGSISTVTFYNTTTPLQSTIIIGPGISPSPAENTTPGINDDNYSSALLLASLSDAAPNVGTGIALGGRQEFNEEITAFARVCGVSAGPIEGDLTLETLYQPSGSKAGLIERMRIKNTGNVGIGTDNPQSKLDVNGSIFSNSIISVSTITGPGAMRFFTEAGYSFIETGSTFQTGQGNTLVITNMQDTLSLPPFVVDTVNSRIGIKTLAPATALVVNNSPVTSALSGIAVNSSDVNTVIGNVAGSNNGSIQVTSGGSASNISATPYNLSLQPLGGEVNTGSNLTVGGNLTVNGDFIHKDVPPIGAINMYAGVGDPTGWLICDGRSFASATYPTLFAVIGTTFGGGGGNFNIPDMRNRFPVGVGSSYAMAATGGNTSVTLTTNELPSHSHGVTDNGHTHPLDPSVGETGYALQGGSSPGTQAFVAGQGQTVPLSILTSQTGISINNTGSGNAFDIRPLYIAINYIIKY